MLRNNAVIAVKPPFGGVVVKGFLKKLAGDVDPVPGKHLEGGIHKRDYNAFMELKSKRESGVRQQLNKSRSVRNTSQDWKDLHERGSSAVPKSFTSKAARDITFGDQYLAGHGEKEELSGQKVDDAYLSTLFKEKPVSNLYSNHCSILESSDNEVRYEGRRPLLSYLQEEREKAQPTIPLRTDACNILARTKNAKFGGSRNQLVDFEDVNSSPGPRSFRSRLLASFHKLRDKFAYSAKEASNDHRFGPKSIGIVPPDTSDMQFSAQKCVEDQADSIFNRMVIKSDPRSISSRL